MTSGPVKNTPDGGENGKRAAASNSDAELEQRRQSLEAKIAAKVTSDADKAAAEDTSTSKGVAQAFKLSSEFIAGVVAGAGLGYLIDQLAGTTPWGMIIFLLLGFAAGVLNVLRSAGAVAQPDYAKSADKRDDT